MSRDRQLLELAAEAMEDGRDPFDLSFLSANEVTADECYTMGEQIALAVRMMLVAPKELAATLVVGVALGKLGEPT